MSAPQSPSGNHRASSSWSTAPTGTTRSFHIALAGREGRRREGRGVGVTSPPLARSTAWELLPPALCLDSGPEGRKVLRKTPEGSCRVSFLWTVPRPHPDPPYSWGPGPSAHSTHGACLTRTTALHGAVGSCRALGTGRVAASLVQVQALLTLGAEVVTEAGLTVLNLAF